MGFSVGGYGRKDYNDQIEESNQTKFKAPIPLQDSDSIEKTDGEYQEEYVPPVFSPKLGSSDPNASKLTGSTTLTDPDAFFEQNLDSEIQNTPLSSDAKNAGFTSQKSLANALTFAYNHPEAESSDFIKGLLQNLTASVKSQTQAQFNLGESWTAPEPDSATYDSDVTAFTNNTFSDLLNADNTLSDDDKNKLLNAHYTGNTDELSSELLSKFAVTEGLAQMAASETFGLPDDYQIGQNSSQFEEMVSTSYDANFQQLLDQATDLTDNEKAQLMTLHQDPEADVPDKDALLAKLATLNQQAQEMVRNSYGLGANAKVAPNNNLYNAQLNSDYSDGFLANVQNSNLSPEMKALLSATKGFDASKLSPEAKAQFDLLKTSTLNAIIQENGLPDDWEPTVEDDSTEETAETEGSENDQAPVTESKKKENTSIQGRSSHSSEELEETGDVGAGVGGVSGVQGRTTARSGGVAEVIGPTTDYDPQLVDNFLNNVTETAAYYQQVLGTVVGDDFNTNDYMIAVSRGLNTMRASMFEQQISGAETIRNTAMSMVDNSNAKAAAQMEKLEEERNKKDVIEFLVNWFPLTAMLPDSMREDLIEAAKFAVWVVDLVLGGVISTIADAAGIKPMYPDWAKDGIGAKITMALQIIVMIVLMAVSIIAAQPGLAGALVAQITTSVMKLATATAVQAAKQAAVAAAKKAVAEGVKAATKETAKAAIKEATEKAIKEAVEKSVKESIEQIMKKGVVEGMEDVSQEAIEKACQQVMKSVQQNIDSIADDIATNAIRRAADTSADQATYQLLKETTGNAAKRGVREIKNVIDEFTKKVVDQLKRPFQRIAGRSAREVDNVLQQSVINTVRRGVFTANHTLVSALLLLQSLTDAITAIAQGSAQIAIAVRKAEQAREQARLDALVAQLDGSLSVSQTSNQFFMDALSQIGESLTGLNALSRSINESLLVNFSAVSGRG